ncbi:hypothetical protein [Paenibacillus sp. y28]
MSGTKRRKFKRYFTAFVDAMEFIFGFIPFVFRIIGAGFRFLFKWLD